jgi:hypothetical protein
MCLSDLLRLGKEVKVTERSNAIKDGTRIVLTVFLYQISYLFSRREHTHAVEPEALHPVTRRIELSMPLGLLLLGNILEEV